MPEIFIFQSSFQEVDLMHVGLMRETPYLPRFTNRQLRMTALKSSQERKKIQKTYEGKCD